MIKESRMRQCARETTRKKRELPCVIIMTIEKDSKTREKLYKEIKIKC